MADEVREAALHLRGLLRWQEETAVEAVPRTALAAAPEPIVEEGEDPEAGLAHLAEEAIGDCTSCKLSEGRRHIVFGVGDPKARLMFVGEGPGADEDRLGEPFVGAAGQLLDKIIEQGMGLSRADVYIANIVKCRPPGNRDPEPDEVEACEPFLREQIRIIAPEVIVALGRVAAVTLLREETSLAKLRGRWHTYAGIPLRATYHPAFLLRRPETKRRAWEDVQAVMERLGLEPAGRHR